MHPPTSPTRRDGATFAAPADPRASRILARSLFKDMTQNGLSNDQILAVASELIALVTDQLKARSEDTQGTA